VGRTCWWSAAATRPDRQLYFSRAQSRKVFLVIRGDDLNNDMSSYLVKRIEQAPNIDVLRNTEVRRALGDGFLNEVENGQQ